MMMMKSVLVSLGKRSYSDSLWDKGMVDGLYSHYSTIVQALTMVRNGEVSVGFMGMWFMGEGAGEIIDTLGDCLHATWSMPLSP